MVQVHLSLYWMKIYIDDIELNAPYDSTILECCSVIGIDLPRFCYHQELSVAGNCRMCLVEIEKSPKPIAACAMPISSNMKIFTNTPIVKKAREGILELLLLNHPLDCPICDQGGECDLQEQVMQFGSDKSRFYEKKRTVEDKNFGPLIKTIMTRCIHCTRCVRFVSEVINLDGENLGVVNRGQQTEITTFIEKFISNELSGNLIDLCPVGALTSKPYSFNARPWELKSIESIDTFDSLGISIKIYYKEAKIVRITPQFNQNSINKEWITDKIRFSYDGLYKNRLIQPLKLDIINSNYKPVFWDNIVKELKTEFLTINPKKICFIVGNDIDSESLVSSKLLVDSLGISKIFHDNFLLNNTTFSNDYTFDLDLLNEANCFFFIGTNPRYEINLLNLKIQQNNNKKLLSNISIGSTFNSTYKLNKFISLTLKTFLNVIEGKHIYSKKFKILKNTIIFYGSSILNRIDLKQFFKTICFQNDKLKIFNQNFINLLLTNSNNVGNMNLGISSFSFEIFNKLKLIYLIHPNQNVFNLILNYSNLLLSLKKPLPIIIYQGSHFPLNEIKLKKSFVFFNFINYYLPGKTFIEKEGNFFNIENRCQKTSKIFDNNNIIQSRDDSQILQILAPLFIKNLKKKLLELIPSYNGVQKNNILYDNFNFFQKIKLNKTLLKPIIDDFYLTNIISQNSIIMGKCSNLVKKYSNNFYINKN